MRTAMADIGESMSQNAGEEFRDIRQSKDEAAVVDAEGFALLGGDFSGLVNIRDLGGRADFVKNDDGTYSTVMCCW